MVLLLFKIFGFLYYMVILADACFIFMGLYFKTKEKFHPSFASHYPGMKQM